MNTDFLKYDAASIRELLRRKLLESGAYTDQIYPGSDISILIDLMSWMFNVFTYMLNENASDVLFADSNVYENLNKMVKLLSYDPKSYITSNAAFMVDLNTTAFDGVTTTCRIPKFASISTGKSDSSGNEIRYSFVEDYSFNLVNGAIQLSGSKPILSNGIFKHYVFDQRASGEKFSKFTMNDVGPNADVKTLIDNDSTHVYIEYVSESGENAFEEVTIVKSLVLDAAPADLACELRLNDRKELEVKFGDGLHGKVLDYGTVVHMIYLQSNGPDGVIDAGEVSSNALEIKIDGFASRTDMLRMLYGGDEAFKINYQPLFTNNYTPLFKISDLTIYNIEKSSDPIDYEGPEEIKEYAPDNFRLGNRLVTASDFRTFVMSNFKNRFRNVSVINNQEYCSTFYKWLDKFGQLNVGIRMKNYMYASACDFNNIYVFLEPIKASIVESDREAVVKACESRKSITTDVIPCEGVKTYFMPFVQSDNFTEMSEIFTKAFSVPAKIIIKTLPTYLSKSSIRKDVASIITSYFNENATFGSTINFLTIQQKIFALGYVESIKTVSTIPDDIQNGYYSKYVDGLSFAAFTPDLIMMQDFGVAPQRYVFEKFQYGVLFREDDLVNYIEVANDNSLKTLRDNEF